MRQKKQPKVVEVQASKWYGGSFRTYVDRLCEYFRGLIGCEMYTQVTTYEESIEGAALDPGNTALAAVTVNHPYMDIKLAVGKPLYDKWAEGDRRGVAEVMCHEFCHVMTSGLYKWAERGVVPASQKEWIDDKERATTWVARVVMRLVPEEVWKGNA